MGKDLFLFFDVFKIEKVCLGEVLVDRVVRLIVLQKARGSLLEALLDF